MMIRRRLSSVKCGMSLSLPWERRSALLTIRRIAILWQRKKNGNGTLAPLSATIIADQTHFWFTKFHEVLTKKGAKLWRGDQGTSLSPFSRIPCARHDGQAEFRCENRESL